MVADLEELVLSPLLWVLLFLGSYGLFLHDIQQRVRSPFGHVSLVEIPGPEESPSFLNEYLSAMDDILFEY